MTDFFDLRPLVDFDWTPKSVALSYTVGGNTYPYTHQEDGTTRATDARYQAYTTPINTLLTFTASLVVPDPLLILEYRWDFGDGFVGYGPTIEHEYAAANPQTTTTVNVTSNNGSVVTKSKVLNLRPADRIIVGLGVRS